MNKVLIMAGLLLSAGVSQAEIQLFPTLLDHVSTVTQFKSGETDLALLDSVVLIGDYHGKSIMDLQAGFNGNTKEQENQVSGVNLQAGGFFKISTLINPHINLREDWEFLRSVEHGISYSYDFREKKDFISYQVGLAFSLDPVQ